MPRSPEIALQSGALPYRIDKSGRVRVLLVGTRSRRGRWGIPKGAAEPAITLRENAAKEAFEEAGVTGTMAPYAAGCFRATKRRGLTEHFIEVWVYLLEVDCIADDWPEKSSRLTKWVKPAEAAEILRVPFLARLCRELAGHGHARRP
jgi:8-oxo-dGTP pyrophosphatase MutT (NUDIX family)